ncbi:hypothetical protein Q4543_16130 [Salipiger sp. 1_MG-2023]|uniref:hypothetical protein n=1 Tax=Salipiger sp. 1_MG-2023 TaxID=3062665 RepID=UPI0026E27D0F|nr:hypothetical protein [Salipiger sp. 1_MG-2023]MDO6587043.1 hypothetical protein [Salipiger sp. 1_MG-2023]
MLRTERHVTILRAEHEVLIFTGFVLLAAVFGRLGHLQAAPGYDELYHILAAQSWLEDGSLRLYQGSYERTPLYTALIGWMFSLAGEPSLVMARLPSVVFGALTAAGAALWSRRVGGPAVGWIVALFLLFWPSGIQLSQTIRFYTLHGMLFFIGAIAVYQLFEPGQKTPARLGLIGLALAALWFANQFQDSTLVGVLALAIWIAGFVALPRILQHKQRVAILVVLTGLLLAAVTVAFSSGMLASIWEKYTISPWGRDITAYHRVFSRFYPAIWSLTPFLAILALRSFPRPAGFCVTLVVVGLIVHSFAGVQNQRYVYYISPFMFTLWAMGLLVLVPALADMLRRALSGLPRPFSDGRAMRGILVLAAGFAVLTQDALPLSVKLMMGRVAVPLTRVADWSDARPAVEALVEDGALIVVNNELSALYYLGGFDVVFSNNWLPEMNETEFARDPRTGRPLISDPESLRALVRAYPDGAFVVSGEWWKQWTKNNSIGALLQAFDVPGVSLTTQSAGPVWILHWRNTGPGAQDDASRALRAIVDPGKWTR